VKARVLCLVGSLFFFAGAALAQIPVIEPRPAGTFHSPFNGEKSLSDVEGQAYTNLQMLYDLWQDDLLALAKAKACGSFQDIQRAEQLVAQSAKDFDAALETYIGDWSSQVYGPKGPQHGNSSPGVKEHYERDKKAVMDLLEKNHKSVVKIGECPKTNMHPGGHSGEHPGSG